MPRMKGGDRISEFLIAEEVPGIFGICGHGNVDLLESPSERHDRTKPTSPADQ